MSIRSAHSRRKVPITRSQMAFARGAWTGVCGDPDGVGGEDGVEGSRVLGVAIADEELDRARLFGEVHREVAGLLGDPAGDRVGRDAGDSDTSRVVVDEHEHVEPAEKDGVDMEEVARHQPLGLGREELRPGRSRSSRRRFDAVAF
jgi:hypothetical protein